MLLKKTLLKIITKFFCLLYLLYFVSSTSIYSKELLPEEFKIAKIEEKVASQVNLDSSFYDSDGNKVSFKDLLNEKPVLLNFVYYTCPRLCHFLVDGIVDGLNGLDKNFYSDFNIISISFDDRDNVNNAKSFKDRYIKKLNSKENINWKFLVSADNNIKSFTNSVGFNFYFNNNIQEYAHGSAIIVLTKDGKISRYLHGITFRPFDLKLSILEALDNKFISNFESALLYCYNYDPDERGYVFESLILMRVASVLTLLFLAFFLYNLTNYKKNEKKL